MDEHVGPNLRELRKKRSMSQALLGQKLGVDETTVGRIERGEVVPQPQTLKAISDLFGVPPDELRRDRATAVREPAVVTTPPVPPETQEPAYTPLTSNSSLSTRCAGRSSSGMR
jgi:transcriptional regulator with XRE-family HTH domain